eukprot:TRINITY_DN1047_c0_g2_i1.p1 TRINITY_DN1047_c0_g2~~TRINITY_DN1047_c0_g2_i1.p1  ORF type:complete len:193 (-),score=49.46 TRINITY_DN1047_c0_g2_i1:394-972(-)
MFILDWFFNILSYLGLTSKNAKILFVGLDNAGKTTLMHMLKEGRVASHTPTQHATMEELTIQNIKFQAHDLGGHAQVRSVWKQFFVDTDAIVFLVDSFDRERFPESKKELDNLLSYPELSHIPFLVLGNKIDMPRAASEDELRMALGIHHLTTGKGTVKLQKGIRPIEVFMCSIIRRQGYGEGFRWLSQYIN